MAAKRIRIVLENSYIEQVTQYDGTFAIELRGNRKNRKGNMEFYTIRIKNVKDYWLTRLLKLTQKKVAEYKSSVMSFASRFGV